MHRIYLTCSWLTADSASQVAEILSSSEELALSTDSKRIKRVKPLDPESAMAEVDARSIYAAPFPYDVTIDGTLHTAAYDEVLLRCQDSYVTQA